MTNALWHEQFSEALTRADTAPPAIPDGVVRYDGAPDHKRFNVYRNNHIMSLINNLRDGFPVVASLVGDEFFDAMAKIYAQNHPPTSPVMVFYGTDFADFIRGFSPADSLPYLGDVAMLEFAQRQALHASDAPFLPPTEYPSDAEELLCARVEFHPSWRLLESQYPLFDIWQAHQAHQHDGNHSIGAKAQSIALIRQQDAVVHQPLDADGLAFFEALASGYSFAETAERIATQNAEQVQKWIQLALASATALTFNQET